MTGAGSGSPDRRRRDFREFVRTHHPDVGGDPEIFRRGLDEFRAEEPIRGTDRPAPVEVHRRRRGPGVFLDHLAAVRRRRRRPPRVR